MISTLRPVISCLFAASSLASCGTPLAGDPAPALHEQIVVMPLASAPLALTSPDAGPRPLALRIVLPGNRPFDAASGALAFYRQDGSLIEQFNADNLAAEASATNCSGSIVAAAKTAAGIFCDGSGDALRHAASIVLTTPSGTVLSASSMIGQPDNGSGLAINDINLY